MLYKLFYYELKVEYMNQSIFSHMSWTKYKLFFINYKVNHMYHIYIYIYDICDMCISVYLYDVF